MKELILLGGAILTAIFLVIAIIIFIVDLLRLKPKFRGFFIFVLLLISALVSYYLLAFK